METIESVRQVEEAVICVLLSSESAKQAKHILPFHLFGILHQVAGMAYLRHGSVDDGNPVHFFPAFFIQTTHLDIGGYQIRFFTPAVQGTDGFVDKCE